MDKTTPTTQGMDTSFPAPNVRPKGVWLVTIWFGLFAGLMPLAAVFFIYFGPPKDQAIISGFAVVVSASIGLCIVVSAIAAWLGHGWARWAMVGLAVLHYGLLAYNNYNIAISGILPEGKQSLVWGRVVKSLITLTAVVVYLLVNRRAKGFFKDYRRSR